MDHLPKPIDGERPRVQLYADIEKYEPEVFFLLPSKFRCGEISDLVENGTPSTMDIRELNRFIQSWLFFALLAQVLNQTIDVEDFLWGDGKAQIHTNRLSSMINRWVQTEQEETDRVKSQSTRFKWIDGEDGCDVRVASHSQTTRWLRSSMALETASRFINKHCSHKRYVEDSSPTASELAPFSEGKLINKDLDDVLVLSIAILGETLQQARPRAVSLSVGRYQFFRDHKSKEAVWGYNPFCREQMRKSGFCPLEIRRMESSEPSVTLNYYACFIEKKDRPTHTRKCTVSACTGQGDRMEPWHMKATCHQSQRCQTKEIQARESKLQKILAQKQIPLAKYVAGRLELNGYSLCDALRFGVLSHSWEEAIVHCTKDEKGRDNRQMHVCQLEALQNTFNKLARQSNWASEAPDDVPFYVDILCMPKQPGTRAAAINQLKHIYQKASLVLVWDRNMLKRPKTEDIFEVSTRVRTGDWITRLWTFQEISLAKPGAIHIAFAKEATICVSDMEKVRDRVHADLNHPHHYLSRAGHPFSKAIVNLRTKVEYRVQNIWEAVQHRQILNAIDETIVLASVLGVDVTAIQQITNHSNKLLSYSEDIANQRMAKLLHILDTTPGLGIPSGIIFLPGRKLPVPGLEWAPSTWLTKHLHPHRLYRPVKQAATLMKDGALVQFPGIVLHCPIKPVEKPEFWFPVHESMHKLFKVRADIEAQEWDRFWREQVTECQGSDPAIIMCTGETRDKWEVGVLVKSNGFLRLGEIRRVEILCRVWIRLETNPRIHSDWISNMQKNADQVMFGERLSDQQDWCVGGKTVGMIHEGMRTSSML